MQIIFGVIFVIVLVALLTRSNILTARGKRLLFTLLMMIVASAMLYEFLSSKSQERNKNIINAFMQGKDIICKEESISQSRYDLERGTLSFMAKDDIKEIRGTIYSIEDCKLKE